MPAPRPQTSERVILSLAAFLGIASSGDPTTALVALPIAAAAAAALAYREQKLLAGFALALGAAAATAVSLSSVAFVVPAAIMVLVAIVLLPRASYQPVAAVMAVVLAVGGVGVEALNAASRGQGLGSYLTEQSAAVTEALKQAAGPSASAELTQQMTALVKQTVAILPSVYAMVAVFATAFTIAAIAWSAKRVQQPVKVPPLEAVDLTPWVVLVPVVGLLFLAASRLVAPAALAQAVGTNLMLIAGTLLFIQGVAVSAALMKRSRMGTGTRIVTYGLLFLLDTLLHVVSVFGLADLWVNFRKLPREGTPSAPLTPVNDEDV